MTYSFELSVYVYSVFSCRKTTPLAQVEALLYGHTKVTSNLYFDGFSADGPGLVHGILVTEVSGAVELDADQCVKASTLVDSAFRLAVSQCERLQSGLIGATVNGAQADAEAAAYALCSDHA